MTVNIRDITQWKKTGKKSYEIWLCIPPVGTSVYNELEDVHYITTKEKPFVLSGIVGEQWTIDGAKLANSYTFATGEPITPESIERKMKNGILDWVKVRNIPGQTCNFAIQLPKACIEFKNFPVRTSLGTILKANRDGVKHGDGDYLVCSMTPNGTPNFNDVWVVNGRVFPATYNTKNFCLSVKEKAASEMSVYKPETLQFGGKEQNSHKDYVDRYVDKIKMLNIQVKAVTHDTVDKNSIAEYNNNDIWTVMLNAKNAMVILGFDDYNKTKRIDICDDEGMLGMKENISALEAAEYTRKVLDENAGKPLRERVRGIANKTAVELRLPLSNVKTNGDNYIGIDIAPNTNQKIIMMLEWKRINENERSYSADTYKARCYIMLGENGAKSELKTQTLKKKEIVSFVRDWVDRWMRRHNEVIHNVNQIGYLEYLGSLITTRALKVMRKYSIGEGNTKNFQLPDRSKWTGENQAKIKFDVDSSKDMYDGYFIISINSHFQCTYSVTSWDKSTKGKTNTYESDTLYDLDYLDNTLIERILVKHLSRRK